MKLSNICVCVIGAGPRGLSVVERIGANAWHLPPGTRVTVHVVDPCPPGPGQVWRTAQSELLLMNTVSSQITVFTDDSVEMDGHLVPGPSLYEWARDLAERPGPDGPVRAEARELGPDAYPTRAFYGHYLAWAFDRVLRTAPPHVSVQVHAARAVELDDSGGDPWRQYVRLGDGRVLDGLDHVVLATGHVPIAPTAEEADLAAFAAAHGLLYVPPGNPADADLGAIRPGSVVALRGLGLNFFDHMTLLTVGRGGSYDRQGGGLVYRPSGREPLLVAGSRRGLPYHARGENEKGAHGRHDPAVLTEPVVAALRARARSGPGLSFRRDLWPLIAKEVETVHYATLLRHRAGDRAADRFRADYLPLPWNGPGERAVLDRYGLSDRGWDWHRVARPYTDRDLRSLPDFRQWLLGYLREDVRRARAGNVSDPVKAALDVLRDLRNEIRQVVDHGGLTGRSHERDLDRWYTPLNAFLSIGPPSSRIEEMGALIRAGVLEVSGPLMEVRPDPAAGRYRVGSAVPGASWRADALIEARMPDIDMRRALDPLVRYLRATGQCSWHLVTDPSGVPYESGGLAVTERPYHLVDAAGVPHPARFALGVPTEAVHWVTAAGIRPAVNSVTLADTDAVALTVLGLAGRGRADRGLLSVGA